MKYTGWLSPTAKHYPCSYAGHFGEARKIAKTLDVPEEEDEQIFIENKGYIHISDMGTVSIFNKPTRSQINWLVDRLYIAYENRKWDSAERFLIEHGEIEKESA